MIEQALATKKLGFNFKVFCIYRKLSKIMAIFSSWLLSMVFYVSASVKARPQERLNSKP